MAGVKGKSGGARPNTGGARPGAGRKPKPAVRHEGADMLALLTSIATGALEANAVQVRAAIEVLKYTHGSGAETGKKEKKIAEAAEIGAGRFGTSRPPLSVVK